MTAARATRPPKECPTRCGAAPIESATSSTVAASCAGVYASGSAGPGDSYCPGRSMATAANPAAASGSISGAKSSLLPV